MLQVGRSRVRFPDKVDSFNLSNPSSRTMALVSTQPLTEMSTRNLSGGKKRPEPKAENLPQLHTTIRASTACCRDNFTCKDKGGIIRVIN
jgi:hypothetical protein